MPKPLRVPGPKAPANERAKRHQPSSKTIVRRLARKGGRKS